MKRIAGVGVFAVEALITMQIEPNISEVHAGLIGAVWIISCFIRDVIG